MKNLLATLRDYDPGMLPSLAEIWGIDNRSLADNEAIRAVAASDARPNNGRDGLGQAR